MNIEVVLFPFKANWLNDVVIKYNFSTSFSSNKRYVEQRRAIRSLPLREENILLTKQENEKDLLLNTLDYAKDKRIATPIYNEIIHTSTMPLINSDMLEIKEDMAEYFNLINLTTHLLLVESFDKYELIKMSGILIFANLIFLQNQITKDFNNLKTDIYPVFFANIENVKPEYINSKVYNLNLEFREIKTYIDMDDYYTYYTLPTVVP